jgi:hypothetical protein
MKYVFFIFHSSFFIEFCAAKFSLGEPLRSFHGVPSALVGCSRRAIRSITCRRTACAPRTC